MTELKLRIHDESNGLDYVLVGDYYVPDLKLPEEHRPIGMWGRLHRTYLEQYRPARFSDLCLSGELHTYAYSHDPNGIACIPDLLLENHLFYCVVVGGSSDRTCCSYGSDLRDP